jgi:mono/diheme cytochrome c family protein
VSRKTLSLFGASLATLALAIACSSEPAKPADTAAAAARPATPAVSEEVLAKGKAIYKANCVACHGESGKGDGPAAGVLKPKPRDHTDAAYMSTITDEDMGKIIRFGGAIKGKPLMPSNPQINGADLDALIRYTRSLSSATASAAK